MMFAAWMCCLAVLFCCLTKLCLASPSRSGEKETVGVAWRKQSEAAGPGPPLLSAVQRGKSLLSMTAAVNIPAFIVTMPAAMSQSCR